MRGRLPLAIVICFVALTAALVARAEVTVQQTGSRVVDRAGVIDPETTEPPTGQASRRCSPLSPRRYWGSPVSQ